MATQETVSLREFLQAEITHLKEISDVREKYNEKALDLARTIQSYKDEKANELREQINSERGLYATHGELRQMEEKIETALRPITDYMSLQQGKNTGTQSTWETVKNLLYLLLAVGAFVAGHVLLK